MGFQVTPCAHEIPASSPLPKPAHSSSRLNSASADIPQLKNHEHRLAVFVQEEETHSRRVLQLAAWSGSAHDAEAHSGGGSSLRSNSSANFLSSEGSSLASLPSLGLSFNGGSFDSGGVQGQLLTVNGGTFYADCSCTATLKSAGDQVASRSDGFFYSASSSAANALCLHAWSRQCGGSHEIGAVGALSKKGAAAVRAIVVEGEQVFTSHSDLKIRVWKRSGEKAFACAGSRVIGNGVEHKLLAALPTSWDCIARSLTPGGYTQVRRHHRKLWIEHADAISAMAVDTKQGYLYSASWDRSVKVWRLRDFKCVETFRAHEDAINGVALSEDGFLYTAAADGKIKVWARDGGEGRRRRHCLVTTLEAHRSAVNALALSPDGTLLYSGACDKAVVVWERSEQSTQHACLAGALRGHRQAVLSLATCANALCSGSADKTIRVWQRLTVQLHVCVAVLQGHSSPVKSLSLCFSPSSAYSAASMFLYSAGLDHEVKVWQLNLSTQPR